MGLKDLREFLSRLEDAGELDRVESEVDAEYEIGAVIRRAADLEAPALRFDRVRGHDVPVVANLFGTRSRIAIGLDTTPDQLLADWGTRTEGRVLPPVTVADAPCQENVVTGDDVDLRSLPVPTFNDLDGGPFITAGCAITLHPKTGVHNVGVYRHQVHDGRHVGILAAPYRHIMLQRAAAPAGERFPVAIAIGVPPALFLAAGSDAPLGVDEIERAGGLAGEPMELVPCKTIPLEAPAQAEIVLEAEFVEDTIEEGPFGEFTGYYGTTALRPVLEIKAITHRNDPIYRAAYTGRPPNEDVESAALSREATVMSEVGLPGLRAIHLTSGGCGYFNAVASIDKKFEGYGKMMAMAILGTWPGRAIKTLTIVDADVNPYNPNEVEWAIATRLQPARDVEIIKETVGVILDPSIRKEDRLSGASRTSKMIIDATKYDARDYEREVVPRVEVFERVLRDWDRYGVTGRR